MKIRSTFLKLVILFVINLLSAINVFSNDDEHNILVLHSYHQGLEWTDNITRGILSVFNQRADVNLVFEYLDTKRNSNDSYFDVLYDLYKVKANQIPFEAVIISDNAAFDFMKKYSDEFYPEIPILFCGVNNLDTSCLKDLPNFIGLGEKADHYGTLSSIIQIFPDRKNVLIINDNTLTGIAIKNELLPVLRNFKNSLQFEFETEFTLESLQHRVKTLDNSYVIYLLVINRDINNRFISYRKGISKIQEVSSVPIFGSWDFYEGKGLFGGKITRGEEQGKYVATIAEAVVDGKPIDTIPQFGFLESNYVFDYNEMNRWGISKSALPEGSIIINTPKQNNKLLKVTFTIIILLIIVLLVLVIRLRLKRTREIEMERIISSRTQELNNANKELNEIIKKKDKFLSILAHDLRNSVNAFLNFSILINEPKYIENPEKGTRIRNSLQIVANQTYSLLEDLLFWGQNQFNGNKNVFISFFNLNEALTIIIEKFKINLCNVSINTDFKNNIHINSDINICKFIFRNIIENAIKYSHNNGTIIISTTLNESMVYVKVADTGIGMNTDVIDSIYKRKPIKKEGCRGQQSTGMGLPTVLDYLDAIGGKLTISSEINKGTCCTIVLPIKHSISNQ